MDTKQNIYKAITIIGIISVTLLFLYVSHNQTVARLITHHETAFALSLAEAQKIVLNDEPDLFDVTYRSARCTDDNWEVFSRIFPGISTDVSLQDAAELLAVYPGCADGFVYHQKTRATQLDKSVSKLQLHLEAITAVSEQVNQDKQVLLDDWVLLVDLEHRTTAKFQKLVYYQRQLIHMIVRGEEVAEFLQYVQSFREEVVEVRRVRDEHLSTIVYE